MRRSKRMPSASEVSKARLTASLAASTDGSDIDAMVSATFIASSSRLASRHDARHQARALGFRGIHHAAGEDEVHGLGLADRVRQPLRAADAGNDAELDLRLAEFGIVGGDDEIALHGKLAAAAEREAGDRGDDRLARCRGLMPVGAKIAEEHLGKILVGHFLDIGAGGESFFRSGDDHAADIAVGLERSDGPAELAHQRAVERIERLRPIEPDETDPAARFDNDVFVAMLAAPERFRPNRISGPQPLCYDASTGRTL